MADAQLFSPAAVFSVAIKSRTTLRIFIMTDNKSFAYRLFKAIRANKKALLAARPTLPMFADNYSQCRELQFLIDAMFRFEKFARGAQKALAGSYEPSNFTRNAKSRDRKTDIDFQNFVSTAGGMANQIVVRMLDCQSMLVGAFWQQMLSLEGLNADSFTRVAGKHVRTRLPGLMTAVRQRSASGFSASFDDTFVLRMAFENGAAVNKQAQHFPPPKVEGLTLEQQIVQTNQYWTEIKHFAREAAKTPTNWPTLLDSRNVELQSINDLMSSFHRSLRPEQKALLRKYPDEASRFFANQM